MPGSLNNTFSSTTTQERADEASSSPSFPAEIRMICHSHNRRLGLDGKLLVSQRLQALIFQVQILFLFPILWVTSVTAASRRLSEIISDQGI